MQEDLPKKTERTQTGSLRLNSSVRPPRSSPKELAMEDEMVELYRSIDLLLPASQKRAIQFIGSREGEGTSTIARQFASIADTRFNKSILILDADVRNPNQHVYFDINPELTWEELMRDSQPVDEAIYKIRNSNISISLIYQQSSLAHRLINAAKFKEHIDDLKSKFDLIVIDSAPAATSSEGIVLSACVDGVVLVVEAENTHWQVAEHVKQKVMKNAGNILGVVFNKRRFYTPEFIYRRL